MFDNFDNVKIVVADSDSRFAKIVETISYNENFNNLGEVRTFLREDFIKVCKKYKHKSYTLGSWYFIYIVVGGEELHYTTINVEKDYVYDLKTSDKVVIV